MQITVRYQSIDGMNKLKTFGTIAGVRRYVEKMVGASAEFNSSGMYAVSNDGIGKVTLVEVMNNDTGRKLDCLQAVMQDPAPKAGPFEVWVDVINEDAGTCTPSKDSTWPTLAAAMDQVEKIASYSDGARIIGTTDEAKAELDTARFLAAMQEDKEAEEAMLAAFYPADPGPRRSPGCTCSDMQLNLVGCDCAAEREVF